MKKLLCAFMCLGLLMGCSNDSKKENDSGKTETVEKTDLEKVSEVLTLSAEKTEAGSNIVRAKDNDGNQFIMYIDFDGNDKTLASTLGLKEKEIAFSINNEQDSYFVNLDLILISVNGETAETMKNKMNDYLKGKNLTIDQIKNGLSEKYEKK